MNQAVLALAALPVVELRDHMLQHGTGTPLSQDVMQHLNQNNPAHFNRLLCYLSDVACYCNRGSCFEQDVAPADLDKWFISVPVESELNERTDLAQTGLYDSLELAEADAVKVFGLATTYLA